MARSFLDVFRGGEREKATEERWLADYPVACCTVSARHRVVNLSGYTQYSVTASNE